MTISAGMPPAPPRCCSTPWTPASGIMFNLRPPVLDQGLVAAVRWLAESFERRTGIPCAWCSREAMDMTPTCGWWPTARRRRR